MVDFSRIAEQRLREAMARGELDELPGRGQPLPPDEARAVPPELRMAYKILKNHGLVPREVTLLRDIDAARKRVEQAVDAEVRASELRQLEALCLEYNTMKRRHADLEASAIPHREEPDE